MGSTGEERTTATLRTYNGSEATKKDEGGTGATGGLRVNATDGSGGGGSVEECRVHARRCQDTRATGDGPPGRGSASLRRKGPE